MRNPGLDQKASLDKDTQTLPQETQASIIHRASRLKFHGEVIGKIASSHYYVLGTTNINELADVLDKNPGIFALGVINDQGQALGIIERRRLFNVLGKQYGRDIYKNKPVSRIMEQAVTYDYQRNIFSVSEELQETLMHTHNIFYLLVKEDGRFAGIFSTKDMLIYLSNITQMDINLARSLQTKIVKEEVVLQRPGLHAVLAYKTAKGVGGDFCFHKEYDPGKWVMAICDVSGKGISASLVTAVLGGMFSLYQFENGLERLIRKLNEYMLNTFELEKFVTGIFIDYNQASREVTLYDMGHSYIYLFRNQKFLKLKTNKANLPLGFTDDHTAHKDRFSLVPGDILVLITDGIAEQVNPAGEAYGGKRLSQLISKNHHQGLRVVKDELFADIYRFRGNQPQHDDMSIILLEVPGNPLPS